jgi:hypothetical protein
MLKKLYEDSLGLCWHTFDSNLDALKLNMLINQIAV